jgi:hypothetical protein
MRLSRAALVLLAPVFLAPPASAAERCGNPLISTCINSDTVWPHAGPAQLLTIGGSETVAKGQVGFGLFTTYLSRPITLRVPSPSPGPGGTDQYAVNDQVNGSFLWAYGVTDRLELDFILPITFGQGGGGVQPITAGAGLQDTAVRDLRFGAAYALVPRARVDPTAQGRWGMTARFETSAPTGDEDQFAGERSAVYMPSVAADARFDRFFAAAELGARLRPVAELAGARVGSQLFVGGGGGYDLLARRELLSIFAEVRALPTLSEQHDSVQTTAGLESRPNGKIIVPAEWTIGGRSAPLAGGDLAIHLGGGGALLPDAPITTPRYRFMLSVRYAPLGRDTDHDGVIDRDDRCPRHKGSVASQGCDPEPVSKPAAFELRPGAPKCDDDPDVVDGFDDEACPDEDTDKDTIDDRRDKCPLQAEDFAGLPDGCPEGKRR